MTSLAAGCQSTGEIFVRSGIIAMGEIKILLNQFTFVKKQKPVAWVDGFSIGA